MHEANPAVTIRGTGYIKHLDGSRTPITLESEPMSPDDAAKALEALTPKDE